jgi:hypothetical protein
MVDAIARGSGEPPPAPDSALTRERIAYPILLALGALDAAGYSVIAPVTPAIARATNAGPAVIGALVASFPIGIMIGFVVAAQAVKLGRSRAVLIASLCSSPSGRWCSSSVTRSAHSWSDASSWAWAPAGSGSVSVPDPRTMAGMRVPVHEPHLQRVRRGSHARAGPRRDRRDPRPVHRLPGLAGRRDRARPRDGGTCRQASVPLRPRGAPATLDSGWPRPSCCSSCSRWERWTEFFRSTWPRASHKPRSDFCTSH